MSLTSFLRLPDVRKKFRIEFPKPPFSASHKIKVPPRSERYVEVGTAFDYLFRFQLQRQNPNAKSHERWVAETAIDYIPEDDPLLFKIAATDIQSAKTHLSRFLKTGRASLGLLKSSLDLARLDIFYRTDVLPYNFGHYPKEDIDDLQKLFSIIDKKLFTSKKRCILNPTFGKASLLIGGADADLILDDTLIDIKTYRSLTLKKDSFNQLIGYYTLWHLSGLHRNPPIQKLGIYFSRHAYLHLMNVEEVINFSTYPSFLKWFVKRAKQTQR